MKKAEEDKIFISSLQEEIARQINKLRTLEHEKVVLEHKAYNLENYIEAIKTFLKSHSEEEKRQS